MIVDLSDEEIEELTQAAYCAKWGIDKCDFVTESIVLYDQAKVVRAVLARLNEILNRRNEPDERTKE